MNYLRPGDALLVVDVQNDFLPEGTLAVPESQEVITALQRYLDVFVEASAPVFATRDWHPSNHCSFHAQGGPWPAHCIAQTHGADFPSSLHLPPSSIVISKGADPAREAYSGFQGTSLHDQLQAAGITRLFVGGLSTDYCVLHTVKDACRLNYVVYLLIDAVRAVNVLPDDGARAEESMVSAGAIPLRWEQLVV
ncbi:MAG: isochorismatase family protein [Nitrospira sp. CR1.1]|jgi:nicotinamidase/pyrazinamidase|nr:isochorismatase family protein [Nitrospira sp. CR1.1]